MGQGVGEGQGGRISSSHLQIMGPVAGSTVTAQAAWGGWPPGWGKARWQAGRQVGMGNRHPPSSSKGQVWWGRGIGPPGGEPLSGVRVKDHKGYNGNVRWQAWGKVHI